MRSPIAKIMSEYQILLVKMGVDLIVSPIHKPQATATNNFDLVENVERSLTHCKKHCAFSIAFWYSTFFSGSILKV